MELREATQLRTLFPRIVKAMGRLGNKIRLGSENPSAAPLPVKQFPHLYKGGKQSPLHQLNVKTR